MTSSSPKKSPTEIADQWASVGKYFSAIYMAVAALQLAARSPSHIIMGSCLAIAVVLGLASYFASQGSYGPARAFFLIGGIMGLPLGIVMLVAASKMAAAGRTMATAIPSTPYAPRPTRRPRKAEPQEAPPLADTSTSR
jgi:hypothetical protein